MIQKIFTGLLSFSGRLAGLANSSNFTTCIYLKHQPRMVGPSLINLNPDKHNQGLGYYPFFRLIQIDVMGVLIFLMIHLIKYVFQQNKTCKYKCF